MSLASFASAGGVYTAPIRYYIGAGNGPEDEGSEGGADDVGGAEVFCRSLKLHP